MFRLLIVILFVTFTASNAWSGWTLSWTDNSINEDGFIIERESTSSPGSWAEDGRVGTDITTYFDSTTATFRCYRVQAFNAAGKSGPSNVACVLQVPNAPSNLLIIP